MFRVDPRDADAFASGWGAAEIDNGVVFRWMESGRAVLDVDSTTDWRFLRIYCRFADPVRRDVSLAVTDAGDHDYASGLLRWRGPGLRRQTVVLDRPVAAGRRRVVLDASQKIGRAHV